MLFPAIKNVIKYLLFLGLTLGLLYLAFRGIPMDNLVEGLRKANYWWVAVSLAFALLALVSRAIRWNLLIESLDYKPTFRQSFYALCIGYLANFAAPRMGEVTRCGILNRTNRIPLDKLIGTVILERAFDLVVLIVLLLVLLLFRFDRFGAFFGEKVFSPVFGKVENIATSWIFWLSGALIILAIVILYLQRHRFYHIALVKKIAIALQGVWTGMKSVLRLQKRFQFILHTFILWGSYLVMTWVLVYTLPETSHLGIMEGLFVLVVGSVGISAPVQGGFGVFHLLVASGLVLFNIPYESGLVFATLAHESQSLFLIVLGAISLIIVLLTTKRAKKLSTETTE